MADEQRKIDGYKSLKVYQKAVCVFDITAYFVAHFMDRGHDRTVDQMQQAARSGKQNIVEGYSDAEGSTESEHKLTVIVIYQALSMLQGYIAYINRKFLTEGGVKEQRFRRRLEYRESREGRFSRDGRFGREDDPNQPNSPNNPNSPKK